MNFSKTVTSSAKLFVWSDCVMINWYNDALKPELQKQVPVAVLRFNCHLRKMMPVWQIWAYSNSDWDSFYSFYIFFLRKFFFDIFFFILKDEMLISVTLSLHVLSSSKIMAKLSFWGKSGQISVIRAKSFKFKFKQGKHTKYDQNS